MFERAPALLVAVFLVLNGWPARAWDHPGHMTTAAIAFSEIERARPELLDKIGLLFLAHPDTAPFWVAAGEAKGQERVRRMFIECARWADDSKFTPNDRLTWHTARWAIVAEDAPPEARAAAAAGHGKPVGQALEAANLNFAMLSNHESTPSERALGLCWVLHIVGDIHQPMHVSDLYSKEFPEGNAAAALSYVADPIRDSTIPLHILWDSNVLRTPSLEEVDRAARELTKKHPRSSLPELETHAITDEDFFRAWANESHQIAINWAYDIQTVSDPNKDQDAEKLVQSMINFILNGVSPVDEAPEVPREYWERLKRTSGRRIALAGYRIADLVLSAAEEIEARREFIGR
jgi:hypothetical protein